MSYVLFIDLGKKIKTRTKSDSNITDAKILLTQNVEEKNTI